MADLRLPSLLPKVVDPIWFCVDKPVDDHEELCKLEEEHQTWLEQLSNKDHMLVPIGKTNGPTPEEDEQDDEDGDVDDVSESDNDELDTDMIDERDSADDAEVDMTNAGATSSPPWVLR